MITRQIHNSFTTTLFCWSLSTFAFADEQSLREATKSATEVLKQIPNAMDISNPCLKEGESTEESLDSSRISTQLIIKRDLSPFMKNCLDSLEGFEAPQTFEDAIRLGIKLNETPQENMLSEFVLETYGVPSTKDAKNKTGAKWSINTGLFTHPMCTSIDQYFISRKQNAKKERITNGQVKMNQFVRKYNQLFYAHREAVKNKKNPQEIEKHQKQLQDFYFVFMASIAEHESLSDADNQQQNLLETQFSAHYGLKNFRRPKGVKLYFDRLQSNEDSKRNIGLYQLSASPNGNIKSCYDAWNNIMEKKSKSCVIDVKNRNSESFQMIAASDQIFNAFCGANKIVQSYGIQVNASTFKNPKASSMQLTHSDNIDRTKKKKDELKPAKDRCVSPFAFTNNAYMHFGVLGFTVGTQEMSKASGNKKSTLVTTSNTQRLLTTALEALE